MAVGGIWVGEAVGVAVDCIDARHAVLINVNKNMSHINKYLFIYSFFPKALEGRKEGPKLSTRCVVAALALYLLSASKCQRAALKHFRSYKHLLQEKQRKPCSR